MPNKGGGRGLLLSLSINCADVEVVGEEFVIPDAIHSEIVFRGVRIGTTDGSVQMAEVFTFIDAEEGLWQRVRVAW